MTDDYESRRKKDDKDEKIVGQFLDKYFYPTWTTTTTRNTDVATQITGLDITATGFNNVTYTIDEKAATHYVGKNLQTFAQEINTLDKTGRYRIGWLFDDNSTSEYLVEVWIDNINTQFLDYNTDITDATVTLIKKSDLYQYLYSKARKEDYINLSNDIRNRGYMYHQGYNYDYYYLSDLRIIVQKYYRERAANVLIPRNILVDSLATYSVRIVNHKPIVIKNKIYA